MRATEPGELETLYRQQYLALVRLARLWTSSVADAEDIVQDTFSTINLIGARSPLAVLQAAVANQARSATRRRRREALANRRTVSLAGPVHDHQEEPGVHSDARLAAAVRRLPRRQHDVLIMRYFLDWSSQRTAEVLGISDAAVRSSTHRAVESLKLWMGTP